MKHIPKELHYTETHEWVRGEEDGTVVVGITDHAQRQLGELIFVGLPESGAKIHAQDEVAVLESAKTSSEVYSPVSGEIIEINEELLEAPKLINHDPYGDGWLFKLKPQDPEEFSSLLEAKDYSQYLEQDED